MLVLSARDLQFTYGPGDFSLRLPELCVGPGEAVALCGPSGAGKTTVLKLLGGILQAQGGELRVQDEDVRGLAPAEVRAMRRRRMGLVFQDFALLEYLTVRENVLLPLRLAGELKPVHEARMEELLERLEMKEHATRLTGRLSQGEQQRAALARALVHGPALVLADEPTAALDTRRRDLVRELLMYHVREHQAGLVLVSHDAELVGAMDRTVMLGEAAVPAL